MSYPTDLLPRFKATRVNVLDRADCYRIVKTWEGPGFGPDGLSVHVHPQSARLAREEAHRLNQLQDAGLPFPPEATAQPKPAVKRTRTHCRRGHEITAENTYTRRDGSRQCRVCRRKRAA